MFHAWGSKLNKLPLFHVDIHGKKDSQDSCEIDVGTRSIKRAWGKTSLRKNLIDFFDGEGSKKLEGINFRGLPCKFNSRSPAFGGYWGK